MSSARPLWFEPATTETGATAYYVPATASKAIELLRAHGIQMRETRQIPGDAEGFHIDTNTAGQRFEGHAIRKLEGKWGTRADTSPGGRGGRSG